MRWIVIYILLSLSFNLFAQKNIFEKYDFANGEFIFCFIDLRPEMIFKENEHGELTQGMISKNYYTEDISLLSKIKDEWIGNLSLSQHECGYHYNLFLIKNDSIISEMLLNLECNELIVDGYVYEIDITIITKFFPKMKQLRIRKFSCANYAECDSFFKVVESNPNYVLTDLTKPKWLKLENKSEKKYEMSLYFKNEE